MSSVSDAGVTLDQAIADAEHGDLEGLDGRDVGFARAIASTTLRRLTTIDDAIATRMEKPIDDRAPFARAVLRTAVAQLVFLDTPAHAAIDMSVRLMQAHRRSRHFGGLANAVLRRIAEAQETVRAASLAAGAATPDWLRATWERDYGAEGAQAIMRAHLSEAAIDLTPRDAEASVPDGLEVTPLANGSRRLASGGAITALPGFSDGAWWVQDAVASLPARLLGDVQGKRVLDACAAPGGKTLQLAAAGAQVISADISSKRLRRVRENLARTNLTAEVVRADLTTYAPDTPFDAILLDAPCSATGTIRRHPDIPFLKTEADINTLVELQARLIRHLATLVQPGGRMVYCVCSLQKVEGEAQVSSFLDDTPEFTRVAVPELLGQVIAASPDDISAPASDAFVFDGRLPGAAVTAQGDLRTLPSMAMPTMNDSAGGSAGSGMARGVDGFYAAILERAG